MKELIQQIVADNDVKKIRELLNQNYPIDIALGLEEVDEVTLKNFMSTISNKRLASIIEVSEPESQLRMLEKLPFRRVILLFNHMSNDDIVDILGNLPVGIRKKYLNMMKSSSQDALRKMLNYDPESAGGIMTTEFITMKEHLTVEEALTQLHEISPNTEVINTIFVTSLKNCLIGWIDIRCLFTHPLDTSLHDIMQTNLITVDPTVDQEEVAKVSAKYDLSVVPVVNAKKVLIGIITSDDILHVMQDEYDEDLLLMSGIQEGASLDSPILESIKKRTPSLLINLFTAFIAVGFVAFYQDVISQMVIFAVLLPIITGLGENSASQTLALVTQEMTSGQLTFKEDKKYIFSEIGVALINGVITGLLSAGIIFLFSRNFYLSVIMLLALMISLLFGAVLGFVIPLLLRLLKLDPAISSTMFVKTITDIVGIVVFLSLARLFLPFL
ncbi:magnesium transporter [Granulicatella balaenopterae]|uniref:Magnesium transporter MgtE n=1 Tax=Granulicatella balaenopterae TaxID=137733 RepID=A0A1H9L578_9LACT|nr:magnesium transporter [Granulicatella balaenopterae]SER06315.1 magnesium transporter [Granulicatella balaenopterae]